MDRVKTAQQEESTVSLGRKLASLREKLGLTQNDIASKIYVCKTVIQNIEDDKILNVPTVFLKGYIRAYADIVGLPQEEYQLYLKINVDQKPISEMKNYSHKEQNKRQRKKNIFISLIVVLIIVGVILFFILKEDKSDLIEVTHYISPSISSVSG